MSTASPAPAAPRDSGLVLTALILVVMGLALGALGSGLTLRRFLRV